MSSGSNKRRTLGRMAVASGLIGALVGILALAYPPAVNDQTWSYPFPFGVAAVVSVVLAGAHALTGAGYQGVRLADTHGGSRVADVALRVAIVGFVLLAAAELASGVIGRQSDESAAAGVVGGLFGVASLLVGFGSIVAGVTSARSGASEPAAWWSLVAAGVILLLVVTPAQIADSFEVATIALTIWSLAFIPLGRAVIGAGGLTRGHGRPT